MIFGLFLKNCFAAVNTHPKSLRDRSNNYCCVTLADPYSPFSPGDLYLAISTERQILTLASCPARATVWM